MNKEELDKMSETTASLLKKCKESLADISPEIYNELDKKFATVWDNVINALGYIHQRIDDLNKQHWDFIDNHVQGHLPNVKSPSQMKTALEGLGLDEDYEVAKRVIYANRGSQSVATIDLEIPKNS